MPKRSNPKRQYPRMVRVNELLREGTIIWKGAISSLKRFKDDAREVAAGYECGIGLSDFQDLKQGDIIETFEDREIARS